MTPRAAGLLLGFAADRLLGDPRRGHPVAGFGAVALRLEKRLYADSRWRGAILTGVLVGGVTVGGVLVEHCSRSGALLTAATAMATWTVLGGRSLEREAAAVGALLAEPAELPAARRRLRSLVGRDPSRLDADGVARAVVESVAENTADAVVAPLVWGAVAGVPGLLAYRAANTLDAMVGHRSTRYARFGTASARLDDALNLPGARMAGLLVVALGPDRAGAWRAWRRDARHHPSPNAGVVEAAFAGALGLSLGGPLVYGTGPEARTEQRPLLGDGRAARAGDIARATVLARRVNVGAVLLAATAATLMRRRRR